MGSDRRRGRLFTRSVALLLLMAACGGNGDDETEPGEPSSRRMTLKPAGTVDGAPLGYIEYLPPGYGDGDVSPLLVFLHGGGEGGNGSEAALDALPKLAIPRLIDRDQWPSDHPFVVLMPQYGRDDTEECQIGDDIDAFIDFAIEEYQVDPDRVYLTGVSCGAIGAWDYIAERGDEVIAGAVLVSGHAEEAFAKAGCDQLGSVPAWIFHGAEDSVVPVGFVEDRISELEACDPPPELELTVFPDVDHHAWSRAHNPSSGDDVFAWLLEHSRG